MSKQVFAKEIVIDEETQETKVITIEVLNDVQADALKNEGFKEVKESKKK